MAQIDIGAFFVLFDKVETGVIFEKPLLKSKKKKSF